MCIMDIETVEELNEDEFRCYYFGRFGYGLIEMFEQEIQKDLWGE